MEAPTPLFFTEDQLDIRIVERGRKAIGSSVAINQAGRSDGGRKK